MKTLIAIIPILIYSCSNNQSTVVKYSNGKIKTESSVNEQNHKEGQSNHYSENGNIIWKTYYVNDTLEGPSIEYFPNGKIRLIANFNRGEQNGVLLEYFENGKLKQRSQYKMGFEDGFCQFFYQNGQLKLNAIKKRNFTQYFTEYDSLGNIMDKKHLMKIQILSPLTLNDSIKIKEKVPGFISKNDNSLFILIGKNNKALEGAYSKMKFNSNDSCYYFTIPPQKEKGEYRIETTFFSNNKYRNQKDTVIIINQ